MTQAVFMRVRRMATLTATLTMTCAVAGIGIASVPAARADAQAIGVSAGSLASAIVAPGGKLTVPVIIDISNAGSTNIASLHSGMSWGAAMLTFDSLRVAPSVGWSLSSNTGTAAGGSLSFLGSGPAALPATSTLANAYFTAGAVTGGTRVMLAPTAASNATGQDVLAALRARALDVCIGTAVKWGDANGDGATDIIDAQQIARASVGLSTANPVALAERGDVNADGTVDVIDAQQIARSSIGLPAAARINTSFVRVAATTAMTLAPSSTQALVAGTSLQLTATPMAGAADLSGCATVAWLSSNPAVAAVNASGLVTAVSAGSATVSLTSGSVTAQVGVSVTGGAIVTLDAGLAVLATKAIYFGHQSVGRNILDALQGLLDAAAGAKPTIARTAVPGDMHKGVFANEYNGVNEDPAGKITAFQATIAGGVGGKVDIAFFKFCYVDFNSGTDVTALFAAYKSALAALKAAYPGVRFVHFTVPLMPPNADPYNPVREQFSDLIRQNYAGVEPVFDLARLESTRPDGSPETVNGVRALVAAYSSDGNGHLTSAAATLVATALVLYLASL